MKKPGKGLFEIVRVLTEEGYALDLSKTDSGYKLLYDCSVSPVFSHVNGEHALIFLQGMFFAHFGELPQ